MRLAIHTLTSDGYALALRIKRGTKAQVHIYGKLPWCGSEAKVYEERFMDAIPKLFTRYDGHLFIMASGIVVRAIAPCLVSKVSDPAVVVMDDQGRHAISLLSGHLGGANQLAEEIGEIIGATPVITTASDGKGVPSVDMYAQANGLILEDYPGATTVTGLLVNHRCVAVIQDAEVTKVPVSKPLLRIDFLNEQDDEGTGPAACSFISAFDEESSGAVEGIIRISNRRDPDYGVFVDLPHVQLIPRNLSVGMGCRRGVDKAQLMRGLNFAFNELNLSIAAIKHIASVDLKADEQGLIELARDLNVPFELLSRGCIRKHQHRYAGSDFVEKSIGVRAVSEPCAELTAGKGRFLAEKIRREDMTISIWEEIDS